MVLALLGKNEEVIAVVESPLGEKMQFPNSQQVKLTFYAKLQRWQQVNIICKTILSERRVTPGANQAWKDLKTAF